MDYKFEEVKNEHPSNIKYNYEEVKAEFPDEDPPIKKIPSIRSLRIRYRNYLDDPKKIMLLNFYIEGKTKEELLKMFPKEHSVIIKLIRTVNSYTELCLKEHQ